MDKIARKSSVALFSRLLGNYSVSTFRRYSTTSSGGSKKTTLLDIREKFAKKEPLIMVTSYDYTSTQLIEKSGAVDAILVGDSLGMVMLGHSDTSSVTMEDMVHHSKAVATAAKKSFVVGDMPLGSYETSDEDAVKNAIRLVKQGRVHAVKLEGGKRMESRIKAIVTAGIPVMGHIGLTPQTQSALGGFRVQGKTAEDASRLVEDAKSVEAAGCFAIVVESVPDRVAEVITSSVSVPTIGIGAGKNTSGQILVFHDMFGLYGDLQPKFTKVFRQVGAEIVSGLKQYKNEVVSQSFPGPSNSYTMKDEEWDKFAKMQSIVAPYASAAPSSSSRGDFGGPSAPSSNNVIQTATSFSVTVEPSASERRATKKVAIIGGGAMGSLFAAHLASPSTFSASSGRRPELWIVSAWADHVKAINQRGLQLETTSGELKTVKNLRATSDPAECLQSPSQQQVPCDLALVMVKSNHTRDGAEKAKVALGANQSSGYALTLQNGLGNREILVDVLGEHRVLQGVTNHGAMVVEPGKVRHTGVGQTLLALPATEPLTDQLYDASAAMKEVAAMFNDCGIDTETMIGIERVLWGKLVVNASINPVTAIMGVTNGQVLQLPEAYKLIHSAVEEACRVAAARGIQLPWANPADVVVEVLKKTAANRSSMLQDVMRGEETEIDSINGAIVREAQRLGVSVPVNTMLWDIVRSPSNIEKFRNSLKGSGMNL